MTQGKHILNTPRNITITTSALRGNTTAKLVWSELAARLNAGLERAQTSVDDDTLRFSTPYVPYHTGRLAGSGIGRGGRVSWNTFYARRLYYNPQYSFNGAPTRGGQWFVRMKETHGRQIVNNAKKMFGG